MNDSIPTPLCEFLDQTLAAIPARAGRREQMRAELLAHLLAVFHEECARLHDENAAVAATLRRFGVAEELNQEIRNTVPRREQIWHHLFRKEHIMRWVLVIVGVIGVFVGVGFIMPALARLLPEIGVANVHDDHDYVVGFAVTLLIFGCAISTAGAWSVIHGIKRFRIGSS